MSKVKWVPSALNDLKGIKEYINNRVNILAIVHGKRLLSNAFNNELLHVHTEEE